MELNEKWLSNLIVFVAYAWIWLNVLPWKLYKVHQNTYLYTHSLTHVSNQNGTSYSKWDARNEIDRSVHHSNETETPTICRVNMVSLAWMSERTSPFVGKDHWILDFIRFTVVQCDQHFCFVCELRASWICWQSLTVFIFNSVLFHMISYCFDLFSICKTLQCNTKRAHSRIITAIQKSEAKRTWNKKKKTRCYSST